MKPLIANRISFKAFKEVACVSKYGNNGAYHVYYDYHDYRYHYRIKFHNATQTKALRAAYYLLFLCDDYEQKYVDQGEFKISIVCGNQTNSFYAEWFDAKYLKSLIKESEQIIIVT